jgi:hypothetical protein
MLRCGDQKREHYRRKIANSPRDPSRTSRAWRVPGGTTGMIKLLTAPIRSIVRFPLVQLAFVVVLITFLQAADDKSVLGQLFTVLDVLVDSTMRLISSMFNVKSFTKSWLVSGFMIVYVYLACLLILSIVRLVIRRKSWLRFFAQGAK